MSEPVLMPIVLRSPKTRSNQIEIDIIQHKSTLWQRLGGFPLILFMISLFLIHVNVADAAEKRVVVLGDSLTAGYGLEGGQAFPEQLQKSLQNEGLDVQVDNAGVSGDTSAGGLSRLEWAIEGDQPPNLVIVALGANDMLRGIPITDTTNNLAEILKRLKDKKIPTLLTGIKAPSQYGPIFKDKFEDMYRVLADEYDSELYPFFLEGVALDPKLNLADGIHPNEKGVAVMVKNMTPIIIKALKK